MRIAKHLDTLTRTYTAFDSFYDLINAAGGYRPTLIAWGGSRQLADAYDRAQRANKDPRRAYRRPGDPNRRPGNNDGGAL